MNSKTTGIWFVVAASLLAFILVLKHFSHPAAGVTGAIFPGLRPSEVTTVQIIPAVPVEIRADRVNGAWMLSKPISYPAQSAAIDGLLDALQKLTPVKISAAELRENKNYETEFGFDNPRFSIEITSGGHSWHMYVGKMTAPGDQVYIRVLGMDGAFVADAGWLKWIPHSATDWRSTALVDAGKDRFDSIILTNGTKIIELHRNTTNGFWRMTRPLDARANNSLITDALQQLRSALVTQFVTDDSNVDLSSFGLQPADLDLWLGSGTNFSDAIHVGKNATNDATQVYAKREGWNAIVTTAEKPLSLWHSQVNDFRDPYLFELTPDAPVTEIEVRGDDNFTLQRQGTNGWKIAGEKFPVDDANALQFIKTLAGLRIADFVKAAVTPTDLQACGLAPNPMRQITLLSAIGDSNAVIAQLSFAATTNDILVHRDDENFIYSIKPEDFNRLQEAGWEFRDRRIWSFTANDVAKITLHQDGKTRTMLHDGLNKWSLAADSQGIINGKYIEDTTTALSDLTAVSWVGRNVADPEKFGFNTNNLQITFTLKNGEEHSVNFGTAFPKWQTALASVTLDGERWAFVFPPGLYQFVLSYLTIPANVP